MNRRLWVLTAGAVAAVVLLGGFKLPGTWQRLWRQGDRAVARQQFPQAVQAYEEAEKLKPGEWALRYNSGTASAMGKDYTKAQPSLEAVAKDGPAELKEAAEFNLGNACLAQGDTKQAIEHYKRALYLKPDDVNAKWNLELAKRQQKQQQQQQQQQQQNQRQQKKDQQKQQNQQQKKQEQQPKQQKQQPQPQQMNREEAQRLLQSLSQQDRDLQKKLRQPKQRAGEARPDKDW